MNLLPLWLSLSEEIVWFVVWFCEQRNSRWRRRRRRQTIAPGSSPEPREKITYCFRPTAAAAADDDTLGPGVYLMMIAACCFAAGPRVSRSSRGHAKREETTETITGQARERADCESRHVTLRGFAREAFYSGQLLRLLEDD